MVWLRRYLIAGVLVWVPLVVTFMVVRALLDWTDSAMLLVPLQWRPETLLGFEIPGLGAVIVFTILLMTGLVVANLFGRTLVDLWECGLARIPLVRSVYSGAKQLAEAMFGNNNRSFRKVVLIEFPREGLWSLAFQTSTDQGEAQLKTGHKVINVYVPTTPNPTGGYFVMIPEEDVTELDMTVDAGLKMLMSMGAVVPDVDKLVSDRKRLKNC